LCVIGFNLPFWEQFVNKLIKYIESFVCVIDCDYQFVNKNNGSYLRLIDKGGKLSYNIIIGFLIDLKKII
jgi:hypothetical protein